MFSFALFDDATLAAFSLTITRELVGLGAALITVLGVRICWQSPRYRMSFEERAKDGVITSEEAARRIRLLQWLGPLLTISGCGLLALALLR